MTFIWSPKPGKVIIYEPRGQISAFKCGKGTQEWLWSADPSIPWSGCQLHEYIQQVMIHQDARLVNFSVLKFCFDKNIIKPCFWMMSTHLFVYLCRTFKGLPINSASQNDAFLKVLENEGSTLPYWTQSRRWRLWRLNLAFQAIITGGDDCDTQCNLKEERRSPSL